MTPARSSASRPVGARTRMRSPGAPPFWSSTLTGGNAPLGEQRLPLADVVRNSRQHALECLQWFPNPHAVIGDLKLADGVLVLAAPLLEYRDGLPYLPEGLEKTQRQQRISQVAHLRLA